MPLPHIFPSLPSRLNILIFASATSERQTIISPSEPTEKCLGDISADIFSGSGSSPSKQLT
jgi:hypothetical protein